MKIFLKFNKFCIKRLLLFYIFILFISGCSSTSSFESTKKIEVPPSDLSKCKTDEDAAKIMIKGILNGLATKNYQEYIKDFASKDKTPFTQKEFNQACNAVDENLGILVSKQYLGCINKIGYSIALWKAKYSKVPEDIIFEMYIIRENNTYKVSAFIPK